MWLAYGVNKHGELIYISQAPRGATALKCPYCGEALIAKKGKVMAHHFAHAGETCRQVERDPGAIALPVYDNFNLHLPGQVLKELQDFDRDEWGRHSISRLEEYDLIRFNKWKGRGGGYDLTTKGKLVLGKLSLMLFNQFQEPLIQRRHEELETSAASLHGTPDYEMAIADLRLYRAQWRRILSCSLYFLNINDGQYYKIGVTTRALPERIAEIRADLLPRLGGAKIDTLGIWPGRGNVELYFKHRYHAQQKDIGQLTEYFQFDDVRPALRDLRRMKPKGLSPLEQQILAGLPSNLEEQIRLEAVEQKRRMMIRKGMQRAAEKGKHVGRLAGKESVEEFLNKPGSVRICQALDDGLSLREVAQRVGVSATTVQKVKALRLRR
jgi:hypothetical protein